MMKCSWKWIACLLGGALLLTACADDTSTTSRTSSGGKKAGFRVDVVQKTSDADAINTAIAQFDPEQFASVDALDPGLEALRSIVDQIKAVDLSCYPEIDFSGLMQKCKTYKINLDVLKADPTTAADALDWDYFTKQTQILQSTVETLATMPEATATSAD